MFEPVRKAQDAMFFVKKEDGMWMPCGPKEPGAIQTSMQELAAKGLGAKVPIYAYLFSCLPRTIVFVFHSKCLFFLIYHYLTVR